MSGMVCTLQCNEEWWKVCVSERECVFQYICMGERGLHEKRCLNMTVNGQAKKKKKKKKCLLSPVCVCVCVCVCSCFILSSIRLTLSGLFCSVLGHSFVPSFINTH